MADDPRCAFCSRRAPKHPVTGGMEVNAYKVLANAVEGGIAYGWGRAHKHYDTPSPETIRQAIEDAVLHEVCEWFDFPVREDEP